MLLILHVKNFLRFSSQQFRGATPDAGEHSRSRTHLQRIEQIRVINTATRKQVHERTATSQTLFFQQGGMA